MKPVKNKFKDFVEVGDVVYYIADGWDNVIECFVNKKIYCPDAQCRYNNKCEGYQFTDGHDDGFTWCSIKGDFSRTGRPPGRRRL